MNAAEIKTESLEDDLMILNSLKLRRDKLKHQIVSAADKIEKLEDRLTIIEGFTAALNRTNKLIKQYYNKILTPLQNG